MNPIRVTISKLFGSPMSAMSFVSFFSYVNEAGKITAKSLMDVCTVLLTYLEAQEKKNAEFDNNFKEIQEILTKLADKKIGSKEPELEISPKVDHVDEAPESPVALFKCEICGKSVKTKGALSGHMRSHK